MYARRYRTERIPLQFKKKDNEKNKDSLNDSLNATAVAPKNNGELPCLQLKMKNQNKDSRINVNSTHGAMNKTITITEKDGELVFSQMMTKAQDQKSAFNMYSLYAVLNNSITLTPHDRELLKDEQVSVACKALINSTACTQHIPPINDRNNFISQQNERAGYNFEKLNALYQPIVIPKSPTLKCLQEKKLDVNTLKLICKNYKAEDDRVFIRPEAKDIVLTSATLGITRNDPDICYVCCGDIIRSLYI